MSTFCQLRACLSFHILPMIHLSVPLAAIYKPHMYLGSPLRDVIVGLTFWDDQTVHPD